LTPRAPCRPCTPHSKLVADTNRIRHRRVFQPPPPNSAFRRLSSERSPGSWTELTDLYTAAGLHIAIQQAFPLADAAQAHRAIDTGHVRGKARPPTT